MQLDGNWLWGEQRNNVSACGLYRNGLTGDRLWVHAVKLTKPGERRTQTIIVFRLAQGLKFGDGEWEEPQYIGTNLGAESLILG